MNMSITKRNFLGYLSILTLVGEDWEPWSCIIWTPVHYFGGYPLIPVYFYIFGIFLYFICLMPAGVMHRRRW